MRKYTYNDDVFTFEGCDSVEVNDCWCSAWRIPFERKDFFPNLKDNIGKHASGVRIVFSTNSKNISLDFLYDKDTVYEDILLDVLYENGNIEHYILKEDSPILNITAKEEGMQKYEIWLDQRKKVCLKSVTIDESATVEKVEDNRKRWVHFGSSISHSIGAFSPIRIWPAIVANELDLHLTNFGYGGTCLNQPMVAKMIRDREADIITLKLGINCIVGRLTTETFAPTVYGFINIIREKKPNIPIVVISPIYSPMQGREEGARCNSGFTIAEMRDELEKIVETCKKYGDENIFYTSGLEVFNSKHNDYLPDGLHPNAEGQKPFADLFIKNVLNKVL